MTKLLCRASALLVSALSPSFPDRHLGRHSTTTWELEPLQHIR
jgi:hypothetical protein